MAITYTKKYAFQTQVAEDWVWSSTGEDPYALIIKKGRAWLRLAGIKGIIGNDIPFLVYLLWNEASKAWSKYGEIDATVMGDVVDTITDHEAEILCETEPVLADRVGQFGVGGCSPEVTAILELLDQIGSEMENRWNEAGEGDL